MALEEAPRRGDPASQDGRKGGRDARLRQAGNLNMRWRWQPSFPPDAAAEQARVRPPSPPHRSQPLRPPRPGPAPRLPPNPRPRSRPSPSASERARSGGDSDAGLEKVAHKVAAVYFQGPCLRHTRVCTRPHTRRCARLSSASPTRPISTRSSAVQSQPPQRRAAQLERCAGRGGLLPPSATAFPGVPCVRPFPPGTPGPDLSWALSAYSRLLPTRGEFGCPAL